MPLTSIIITTHERPLMLSRAVESARLAGTSVEIVVVDDASTDDTARVCEELSGIKYVRVERNQGVAGARNLGVLASCGEYVTFLDDDDLRLPASLDRQVELLEADDHAGLIYGRAISMQQSGEPTSYSYPQQCLEGDVFWNLLGQNFIPCGSAVFRRSCFDRVGLLDSSVPGLDDWDLWIRIAELYSVRALKEPVLHWRQSTPYSRQGTSRAADLVSKSVQQFRRCWRRLPRVATASHRIRQNAWRQFSATMAAHLSWEGLRCLRHGEFAQAMRNLLTLVQLGPLVVIRLLRERGVLHIWRRIRRQPPLVNSIVGPHLS